MNFDGLKNVLSGMGGQFDKRTHRSFVSSVMADEQIEAAYQDGWLIRQCIDVPSFDLFRKWRVWEGDPDAVARVEAEEKRLDVRGAFEKAHRLSRIWGGSLLVIGKGSEALDAPLTAMGPGGMSAVNAIPRRYVRARGADDDLASPTFGRPEYYEYSPRRGGQLKIHPSRVIRFDGPYNPRQDREDDQWGMSVVHILNDAVSDFLAAKGAMAALVDEAKVDVYGIPGLSDKLMTREGDQKLLARLQLNNSAKSFAHGVYMDAAETYEQKQVSFQGLAQVVAALFAHVAAAADIPMTRFAGQSPGGLNSTGEGDLGNYLDRLAGEQQNVIRPRLDDFDVWLMASAGVTTDDVQSDFVPLRQLTEQEQSEVAERNAKSFQIMATSMVNTSAMDAIGEAMMRASPVFVGADKAFNDQDKLDEPLDEGDDEADGL